MFLFYANLEIEGFLWKYKIHMENNGNDIANFYDNLYSKNSNVFGSGKVEPIIEQIPTIVSSGTVLDVGAGQGRNALFLAKRGFNVTASDISEIGLEQLKEQAQEEGVEIATKLASIDDIDQELEQYDVILINFTLHHLKESHARKIIDMYKEETKPGALHVISTFTSQGDFYEMPQNKEMFYSEPGELKTLYKDWEIIEYREEVRKTNATREDGTPMENLTALLIAKKPDEVG